jgi:hypothetical protein
LLEKTGGLPPEEKYMSSHRAFCKDLCAFVTAIITLIVPAFGSPFLILQKDQRFTQTGPGAPGPADGFDLFFTVTSPGSFDGGTVTKPSGAGTATLSPSAGNLQFGSGVITSPAAFNAGFPTGVYSYHLTDSGNAADVQTTTIDDSQETFASQVPALTAASFTALQGLDPTQALTVHFNTFTPASSPFNGPLAFFGIVNQTTSATVLLDGIQPNSGQDAIAANTLQPGTPYRFILFFANDLVTTNTQLQLNDRTQGFFNTAGGVSAPEPGSALLCVLGIGVSCLRRKITQP